MASIKQVLGTLAMIAAATLGTSTAQAQEKSILAEVMKRGTVRIAVLGSLPPFSQVLPNGELEGYDIDIAKRFAADLKVKPEFVVTDIPARVTSLQTRKVDLVIADFTRNVERSATIAFTDPYVVSSLRLMVKADSPAKSVEDLNKDGIRIATTRGGTAEKIMPSVMPAMKMVRFNAQADELNALLTGQVDAMAEDTFYNRTAIKTHEGKLREVEGSLARAEIAIGLPAGDFDWHRVTNLWVNQFNASGENAKLFKKWFGFDQPAIQAQY